MIGYDTKSSIDTGVREKEIIFYDFETTGLSPETDRPVQFSAIKFRIGDNGKFQEAERADMYIRPDCPVGEKAAEVHGLTEEVLAQYPDENARFPEIYKFLGDSPVLCGYNNQSFDDRFLDNMYRRHGKTITPKATLDAYLMVKDQGKIEGLENRKLETVSRYFGFATDGEGFHNSMFDVEMTAKVFMKLAPTYYSAKREKVNVLKVEYWEGPKHDLKRIYVNTDAGSLYYSVTDRTWGAKDISPAKVDMDALRSEVYAMTGTSSEYELGKWTGKVEK